MRRMGAPRPGTADRGTGIRATRRPRGRARRHRSAGGARPAALTLEGEPGVGKTSLWESGIELGLGHGRRVLTARASGAETGLPFAALIDLFDAIADGELTDLPPPQRAALNVALYREDPTGPSEPQGIALGLLSALRALAARERLLVAIDDVQWLDQASEEVARLRRPAPRPRADHLPARPAPRPGLGTGEGVPGRTGRAPRVGPMSLGATRHILAERLGLRLTHHLLRRVYDTTLGNPLFTLEVGRMLAGRDLHALGEDVPVPDDVEDLLGMRVADLGGSVRRTCYPSRSTPTSAPRGGRPHRRGRLRLRPARAWSRAMAIGFGPHIRCLPRRRSGRPPRSSARTSIAPSPRSSPTSGAARCTWRWRRDPGRRPRWPRGRGRRGRRSARCDREGGGAGHSRAEADADGLRDVRRPPARAR